MPAYAVYRTGVLALRMPDQSDRLTHLDDAGRAQIVDVTDKAVTSREARAASCVRMNSETLGAIMDGAMPKGDVLAVARIAGIQSAKKCADLIPLCHPLPLSSVKVDLTPDTDLPGVRIEATCKVTGQTGVEMEALTAASVAALTSMTCARLLIAARPSKKPS